MMTRYIRILIIVAVIIGIGSVWASSTIFTGYGECSGTAAYLGYYSGHVREYWQRIYLTGGYVSDIELFINSKTGDVPGFDWALYHDADGFPVEPAVLTGYTEYLGVAPSWLGTSPIGPVPVGGWYWMQWVADVSTNGNYVHVVLSTGDCVPQSNGFRRYDGTFEATYVFELRMRTYEDYLTPTATYDFGSGGTSMPTLTPTITLTPTPILSIISTLPSGSGYAIERTSTFGDGAIVLLLALIAVLVIVQIMVQVFYANAKR